MKQKKGVVVVGAVTIFLIFTVLLLVTFSVLSFAVARTDAARAERAAAATGAYYTADAAAWEKVETAAALLEADYQRAPEKFPDGRITLEDGRATVTFEVPVSDALTLCCAVELQLQNARVQSMQTIRWQCVPAQN